MYHVGYDNPNIIWVPLGAHLLDYDMRVNNQPHVSMFEAPRVPAKFLLMIAKDVYEIGISILRQQNKEWFYTSPGGNRMRATVPEKGEAIEFWEEDID